MRVRLLLAGLVAVLFVCSTKVAYAGTINVTTTDDTIVADAFCSLREAIDRANAGSDGDGCTGVTAAPNTIVLPAGVYTFSATRTVTSTITIQESGGDAIIQASPTPNTVNYRVFNIETGGNLTLDGVTVRNGGLAGNSNPGGCIYMLANAQLTLTNSAVVESCTSGSDGGAITVQGTTQKTINVTNSTVRNNAIIGNSGRGGAIYCTNCILTLSGAVFSGNSIDIAGQALGGAIHCMNSCFPSINNSTFTNNSAEGEQALGGAVYINTVNAVINMTGVTFIGNSASGLSGQGGALLITNTLGVVLDEAVFIGNSAVGSLAGAQGGAITIFGLGITLTDSRFESNTATTEGGALWLNTGGNSISRSCFTDNSDTAILNTVGVVDATGGGNINDANWWGTSWGPRIAAAGGGSAVSNGDSINGDGDNANPGVDVNLTSAGTEESAPTGSWLTAAPTVAGEPCQTCVVVSSTSHARVCS